MLNTDALKKCVDKYPRLSLVLRSGVVSMKMARKLLDIDRWMMEDLYLELLEAEAVKGVSSSNFRATPSAIEFLEELEMEEADDDSL